MTVAQLKLTDNPISKIRDLKTQISALEKLEKQLKTQIENLCDLNKTDRLEIDGFVAERKLVVATVFDTAKAKEILGDNAPTKEQERITWNFI